MGIGIMWLYSDVEAKLNSTWMVNLMGQLKATRMQLLMRGCHLDWTQSRALRLHGKGSSMKLQCTTAVYHLRRLPCTLYMGLRVKAIAQKKSHVDVENGTEYT